MERCIRYNNFLDSIDSIILYHSLILNHKVDHPWPTWDSRKGPQLTSHTHVRVWIDDLLLMRHRLYDSRLGSSWWIVSRGNGQCRGLVTYQMMYIGHENVSDVVSSWYFAKLRIKNCHLESSIVLHFWIVTGEEMLCGFKVLAMRTVCAPFGDESASWACW